MTTLINNVIFPSFQILPVLLCLLFISVNGIIIKQKGSIVSANASAPSVSRLYRNVPFKIYANGVPHLRSAVRPSAATRAKEPVVAGSKVVLVKSNISAPSVTRLYRNVPHTRYASGELHGHKPVFKKGPLTAASHFVPVKQEQIVIHNKKGYLKDSYGNSFVTSPQMVAYKMTLPHQYVKLQDLPKHLSQPLTSASAGSFYKNSPKFSYGTPQRPSSQKAYSQVQKHQAYSQAPTHQAYSQAAKGKTSNISQPPKFSGNLRTFAPAHSYRPFSNVKVSTLIPQASKQRDIYSNNYPHYSTSSEEEFERLLKSPNAKHVWHDLKVPENLSTKIIAGKVTKKENLKSQVTSQSKKVPVKAAQNIVLETKPPLPHLLDLSLLEPLTFDNPIVPQVQHFLPKINYYIPKVDEEKQHHNEYVVQKTMYYDTGLIKNPQNNKKPQTEEDSAEEDSREVEDDSREVEDEEEAPSERPPSHHVQIRVQQQPQQSSAEEDDNPEFAVNNKSPNYKETLTEHVIQYDNSKENEPKTYSYGSHVTSPPQVYSYSSTSKPYSQQIYVKTNSESIDPVKVVYSSNPESTQSEPNSGESDESAESAEDSREETHEPHESDSGKYTENPSPSPPPPPPQKGQYQQLNFSPQPTYPISAQKYQSSPKPNQLDTNTETFLSSPKFNPALMYKDPKYQKMLMAAYNSMPKPTFNPVYNGKISYNSPTNASPVSRSSSSPVTPVPQVKYQTVKTPVDNFGIERYVNKPLEDFEQNIQLLPPPNAKIRVPPGQHLNNGFQPSSFFGKNTAQQRKSSEQEHLPSSTSAPHIVEKSHKIIIQEESPNEHHSHREQMSAEVIDDGDDDDEGDFDTAYKDSAYGFPAFNKDAEELEKDVYSPNDYAPASHTEYDFEKTPFEQYVDKGDRFPKSARLTYKDDRDDLKENYYLDFSSKTPQSYKDRKNHKEDYYKMYEQNTRPEAFFGPPLEERKESKKAENFIEPPRYTYNLQSSQPTGLFAQYRKVPGYEYDYLKSAPRDTFAHASSWPLNKAKTLFGEPQLHYGFQPLTARLLDSELSAMSSNISPKIDKDGTRKKTYKENLYVKRMTTNTSDRPTS